MPIHRLDTIVTQVKNHLTLPGNKQAVRQICTAIKNAASATDPADAEALENLEQMFLSSMTLEDIVASAHCAPLFSWIESLVARRFSATIIIPATTAMQGTRSRRVGGALIRRMEALELTEHDNASEEFELLYEAQARHRASQRSEILDPPAVTAATAAPAPAQPTAESTATALNSAGAFMDTTKFRRTVQMHFTESGERAKFTGDLSKGPSFDLWEKRYRSLVKSMKLPETERVSLLSEALADPALTFFYNDICPDDSRSGNSTPEAAALADSLHTTPLNMAFNVAKLSGALAALKNRFCTNAAQNVLKQELDQLTLSSVEQEEKVSKPAALNILKDRIRRLSCNGPPEFQSEPCMIAALRKCLAGEEWAVDPIINARDRASRSPADNTLEHYVQTLISYLREKETLSGTTKGASSSVPTFLSHGENVYYGDARANPRQTRVTYQNPNRQRTQFQRLRPPSDRMNSSASSGLPAGMDLRRMLTRAPQQRQANSNPATANRAHPRVCWNCDSPGHLLRDCPKPPRPRVDFARAMLVDDVSPMEVAVYMAQEADDFFAATDSAADGDADVEDVIDAAGDDAEEEEADDPSQVFDTLLATMSRDAYPRQDFR